MGAGNSVLIKLNQVGDSNRNPRIHTSAPKMQAIGGLSLHRSGETEDAFISDLAVGTRSWPNQNRRSVSQ